MSGAGRSYITFEDFQHWLHEWIEKFQITDAMHEEQLKEGCRKCFERFDTNDDGVFSLPEFERLLDSGGVEDLLREAGLYDSMMCSSLFDITAIHAVFDKFGKHKHHGGHLHLDELEKAFAMLHMHPTHEEVRRLLQKFDGSHRGHLTKDEFTRLMLDYMNANEVKTSFTQRKWCPIRMFQVDLDFISWGKVTTELLKTEFVSRGYTGLGGYLPFSGAFFYTFETAKTRWLHVEGNPIPLWKLNVYFGEALLLYTLMVNNEMLSDPRHVWLYQHRLAVARVSAAVWWLFRSFMFFVRKRGVATAYSWGKPKDKQKQSPKHEFPVPIPEIESLMQQFLQVKGIDLNKAPLTYRTKIPGYGFIPLHFSAFQGIHTIFLGDRHFQLEKVAGGGGGRIGKKLTRIDNMAGLLDDVKWIAVTKYGKNVGRLVAALLRVLFWSVCLAIPILLVSAETSCLVALDLRQYTLRNGTLEDFDASARNTWCLHFSGHSRSDRIGQPCVCSADGSNGADGLPCNSNLDPSHYVTDRGGWCAAYDHNFDHWWDPEQLDGSKFFQPCECVSTLMQFAPDLSLLFYIVVTCCCVGWPLCIGLWIWYTPIWADFGVIGINPKQKNHFARVRISPKQLYEFTFDTESALELVTVVKKVLALAVLAKADGDYGVDYDESSPELVQLDVLASAEFLAGQFFDLCIDDDRSGYIDEGEITAHRHIEGAEGSWVAEVHNRTLEELTLDLDRSERSEATVDLLLDYDNLLAAVTRVLEASELPNMPLPDLDHEDFLSLGFNREVEMCVVRELQILELQRQTVLIGSHSQQADDDTVGAADVMIVNPLMMVDVDDSKKSSALTVAERTAAIDGAGRLHAEHGNEDGHGHGHGNGEVTSKRDRAIIAENEAQIKRLRDEVTNLRNGSKIMKEEYVASFLAASLERQSRIGSHRTRARLPMTLLRRKLHRPLKHKLLRRWRFRPLLSYVLWGGHEEQLLIHEDYVTLRIRKGTPVCCCCCELAADYCDYSMLLKDVYFVETVRVSALGWPPPAPAAFIPIAAR